MRIAGVDIGGTSIKLGIFEDDALIFKTSAKTPFGDPEGVCDVIAQLLERQNVELVGVGTAGSVEFRHDTVSASTLGWEGWIAPRGPRPWAGGTTACVRALSVRCT